MFSLVRILAAVLMALAANGIMLCAAAQSTTPSVTPEMTKWIDAHRALLSNMNAPGAGGRLRSLGDAQMRPLLAEGWNLAEKWAGAWLDLHPNPSAEDLDNLFVDFSPPPNDPDVYDPKLPDLYALTGSAIRVAIDVYVVTADYEESQSANAASTFFIVDRDVSGHFKPKWNIKPLAEGHYSKRDEIGRWAFLDSCFYYCGPLVAQTVMPLPASAKGEPRFAIDAYQATNGSTLLKQLSIWQWNGNEAQNLVIRSYDLSIEEDSEIQLVKNLLTVPTKERTDSFGSLGCCAEPRGMWILRITPEKVQDLGHRFLQPQIQWADRLVTAVGARSSVAARLASPSVISYLKHTEIEADSVDKCHVLSSGKKGAFEITFGVGTKLWLAYYLRGGQPYFTHVRVE
jgi:hypothetical protein